MRAALLQARLVMLNKELQLLGADKLAIAALTKSSDMAESPELVETVVLPGYRNPVAGLTEVDEEGEGKAAKEKGRRKEERGRRKIKYGDAGR